MDYVAASVYLKSNVINESHCFESQKTGQALPGNWKNVHILQAEIK